MSLNFRASGIKQLILLLFCFYLYGQDYIIEARSLVYSVSKNQELFFETNSGDNLRLVARAFEPGELILAQLKTLSGKDRAWLRFNQNKIEFLKLNSEPSLKYLALIGFDGQIKPGKYNFELTIWREDRSWECSEFFVEIGTKKFRERKLRVSPKYIQPPAELKELLEREAELLRAIFSIRTPEWLGDGPFILPHSGKLTAYFGDQRLYNNLITSFHNGIDLAAGWGEPIMAANSGRVVIASNFYFSGKTVVIDHGLGLFTSYNHLSKVLVKRSQPIKKGEIIGLAGSSGLSTGAHLHWSARLGQSRLDPLCLLEIALPHQK